jgi:tartrate-resistant acid phosphatase type 5
MLSRRRFLGQTFAFSAAAAIAGGINPVTAAPALGPPVAADASAPRGAGCHLLAIGDCGVRKKDLERQRAVSEGMTRYARRCEFRPDALAMLGDNFYGGLGGSGVASPRWERNIEAMYPAESFPGPLYAVLGNHDYGDEAGCASAVAQLAYRGHAPQSRWTMPHKWYRFDLEAAGEPLAKVLVIDTNFVFGGGLTSRERKKQWAWLANELSKRRQAPFVFVLGHHPVFSDGSHGDTRSLIDHLDPLLRRHKVDLYLCGHDHDLQHIELKGHPTSFVVSGAGGARAREIRGRKRGAFAKAVYGFTHIELQRERFTLRHVDANGRQLHAFTKSSGGRVKIERDA